MRVLIAALMVAGPAYAQMHHLHDLSDPSHNYPLSCCSRSDCAPVPVDDVRLIDGKWVVSWGGQEIEFDQARPSFDGQFHICTRGGNPQGALITVPATRTDVETGPCFWAPQGF